VERRTGHLEKALPEKHLKGLAGPINAITGLRAIVLGLSTMLNKAGVDNDDIRTEEFSGYY